MRNKWTYLSVIAATALGFSAVSHADAASTSAKASTSTSADYSLLDADRDGKVSKREAGKNKDLMKKFATLDTNTDGNLDSGEFALFEGSASTGVTNTSSSGASSTTGSSSNSSVTPVTPSTSTTAPGSASTTNPTP